MEESKEENNSQLAATMQASCNRVYTQAQPRGHSGVLTLSGTLSLTYLCKQTLTEVTRVELGPSLHWD